LDLRVPGKYSRRGLKRPAAFLGPPWLSTRLYRMELLADCIPLLPEQRIPRNSSNREMKQLMTNASLKA
jgi:hypothetical protein